jgi:hypothetical protein
MHTWKKNRGFHEEDGRFESPFTKPIEMQKIQYAQSSDEIEGCWEVVHALRPHLEKEKFLKEVMEMMTDATK